MDRGAWCTTVHGVAKELDKTATKKKKKKKKSDKVFIKCVSTSVS